MSVASAEAYRYRINAEVFEGALRRDFFDVDISEPRGLERSRGMQVFVDFATFISEQRAADGCDSLYVVYCEQMRAFVMGLRNPTPLVGAFGARSEDVRWLTKLAYDTKKAQVERSLFRERILAADVAYTNRVEPVVSVSINYPITQEIPAAGRLPRM